MRRVMLVLVRAQDEFGGDVDMYGESDSDDSGVVSDNDEEALLAHSDSSQERTAGT